MMLPGGMRVVIDDNIPSIEVRHDLLEVRFDHSSGHREWRRLVRERRKHARLITRRDAYVFGGHTIIMTSEAYKQLREESR